jgi:hypothetical protein
LHAEDGFRGSAGAVQSILHSLINVQPCNGHCIGHNMSYVLSLRQGYDLVLAGCPTMGTALQCKGGALVHMNVWHVVSLLQAVP